MATKEELMKEAQDLDVEGRSTMDKEELEKAVEEARNNPDSGDKKATENDGSTQPTAGDHDHDGVTTSAPMEDPVGTVVDHREELAEETGVEKDENGNPVTLTGSIEAEKKAEDYSEVEKVAREDHDLAGVTTTLNGERASTGDPAVTHANVQVNRAVAGDPNNV